MTELPTRLEEVTVYREGARVVRTSAIPEGALRLRVGGLPLSLDATTLRARVRGASNTAVSVHVSLAVAAHDPALPPAQDDDLAEATLARELAAEEVARLREAIDALDRLVIHARPAPNAGEALMPSPVAARRALISLRASEASRLSEELAAAEEALRVAIDHEREATQRRTLASSARNTRPDEVTRCVEVTLESPASSGAVLEIAYAVPGARWCPAYSLTVVGGKNVRLATRALVAQRTGEDWTGVRLSLSTASPSTWTALPELTRRRIGRAQPPRVRRGYRAPPTGAEALYADYDREFASHDASHARLAKGAGAAPHLDEHVEAEHFMATTPVPMPREVPMMSQAMAMPAAPMATRAPPPAMAMQAPPPPMGSARMTMSASASNAEGALGGFGGAGAPAPRAASPKKRAGRPPAPSDEGISARETFELDVETFAYTRLRVRAASEASRGELVAVDAEEIDLASLPEASRTTARWALREARRAAHAGLADIPQGHSIATSGDAFDYAYAAAQRCDVPSDGAFHSLAIADHSSPGAVRHVAVPREASDVFRVLSLDNPLDAALPTGPVDVYVGDDASSVAFLLQASMPPTPPRGRVTLGLGVEQGVKIARNTHYEEHATGLLGGGIALEHQIAIDVTNTLAHPIALEIRERVPVAREGDTSVAVELGPVEPPWGLGSATETVAGAYAWSLEIAAKASQTVRARYVVKMAAKLELVGGNRRES